jgi:mycoredoxin
MKAEPLQKQISTRKGLLLIAIVLVAVTAISLVRHWSQTRAVSNGLAVQTADGHKVVAIFTTDACPYCAAAKKFLTEKQVDFLEFNLDHSKKARQVFGMLNGRGVPMIIVGESRLVGFDAARLNRVLVEQGILQ